MKTERVLNSIGWTSGAVCLLAYALVTQQLLATNSLTFLGMNGAGCVGLIYYTFKKGAFANVALNCVHLSLTLLAIGRRFLT